MRSWPRSAIGSPGRDRIDESGEALPEYGSTPFGRATHLIL
ncbi:MAG TPA: hypothetical protein VKA68_07350 [bacterium]|nr:hypothetical protein [bacterium]